jgi:putative FmdB family regulatory protein
VPTYEYRCAECKNQYETREGFDAPALQACPRCGGSAKRVYSAPPIVFKGSGWYVTDSRGKGDSATIGGVGDTKAADTTPTPAPSDSAPAAAPAASGADD